MACVTRKNFFCAIVFVIFLSTIWEEFQDTEETLLENLNSSEAPEENCKIGKCSNSNCTCCSGYYLYESGWFSKYYSCEKCNCGEDFNCTYTDKIKCLCPVGYTEGYEICKADCKNNPCENGGICTVEENKVVCECKKPYTGKLCKEKDPCFLNPCINGGQCIASYGKAACHYPLNCTADFYKTESRGEQIALLALSTTVLHLAFFSVYMLYKYKVSRTEEVRGFCLKEKRKCRTTTFKKNL